jgi:HAMP domain-containing protein
MNPTDPLGLLALGTTIFYIMAVLVLAFLATIAIDAFRRAAAWSRRQRRTRRRRKYVAR